METWLWLIKKDAWMINSGCTEFAIERRLSFVVDTWLWTVDGNTTLAHHKRRDSQLFGGNVALAPQERCDSGPLRGRGSETQTCAPQFDKGDATFRFGKEHGLQDATLNCWGTWSWLAEETWLWIIKRTRLWIIKETRLWLLQFDERDAVLRSMKGRGLMDMAFEFVQERGLWDAAFKSCERIRTSRRSLQSVTCNLS